MERGKHWKNTEIKKRSYRRRRAALIATLGGKCALCGKEDQLELDHIDGRTWSMKLGRMQRLRRYEQEAKEGKIRVACKPCNGLDGLLRKYGGYASAAGQYNG
jgi:hypothetical protein